LGLGEGPQLKRKKTQGFHERKISSRGRRSGPGREVSAGCWEEVVLEAKGRIGKKSIEPQQLDGEGWEPERGLAEHEEVRGSTQERKKQHARIGEMSRFLGQIFKTA